MTIEPRSIAERVALLPAEQRREVLLGMTPDEAARLETDWPFWRRPSQEPPPAPWTVWLFLAGRGFGKTRIGTEWVSECARSSSRIALIGRTASDVRDVMVEGESGILARAPAWWRPTYEPSKRRLTWPNGSTATTFTGEEPDMLRGPQFEKAWGDELAAWKYGKEAFDNLMLGLRIGDNPQALFTTTPKRRPIIRELLKDPNVVTRTGTTYENLANLAPTFRRFILARYEGTRLGLQELMAQLLEDVVGALWTMAVLERTRVREVPVALERVVVSVDPPGRDKRDESADEDEDQTAECGIAVVGRGTDGHGYLLADRSLRGSPREWAQAAVDAYREFRADRIVAEVNNGADMVGYTIGTVDPTVPFSEVWASRGKQTRAEPVSALYERGWCHHVGYHAELEDQMTTWVPGDRSPDRMDAVVWGISELFFPQPTGETEVLTAEDAMERISPI